MIFTATPYRVSFFGGGTDYPAWFTEIGSGATLGMAISKYCYVGLKRLPQVYDFCYRIVYQKVEDCQNVDEIEHPAVRSTLKYMHVAEPLEITHLGDMPAKAGLGASSSFVVGLLNALHHLIGNDAEHFSPYNLAEEAIHVEQNVIKEAVGNQDQCFAAYGGLRYIEFSPNGHKATLLQVSHEREQKLSSSLLLAYTGTMRNAHEMAAKQIACTATNSAALSAIGQLAIEARDVLEKHRTLDSIGEMLHTAWQIKRTLIPNLTSNTIDDLYQRGRELGAIGGKLLGAGGGGYMLFYIPPELQPSFRAKIGVPCVQFKIANQGSRVLINEP